MTTSDITPPAPAAALTLHTALVLDDAAVVLDEIHTDPMQRNQSVLQLLRANHDEVDTQDIDEILAAYQHVLTDDALSEIAALYIDYSVDVYLSEHTIAAGPQQLFSVLTDYGNGEQIIEHYPTEHARTQSLRERADAISAIDPSTGEAPDFSQASAADCVEVLDAMLSPTRGHNHLTEATVRADGTYRSEF